MPAVSVTAIPERFKIYYAIKLILVPSNIFYSKRDIDDLVIILSKHIII